MKTFGHSRQHSKIGAFVYCFIERTWLASWIRRVTGHLDIKQEAGRTERGRYL